MQYFVTSDVHSYFNELITALNNSGFDKNNPEHILCICGDLFDRGPDPIKLFEFVKELNAQKRLIYIRGNHEDLLKQCVEEIYAGRVPGRHHFSNGTVETICRFCGENEWIIYDPSKRDFMYETMKPILDFIDRTCIDYMEIDNYILVHGWIPSYIHLKDFRDASKNDWCQARWLNGMDMWLNPANRLKNKIIVCGHWHCSWGWSHIRRERKEFPQKNRKDWIKSFEPFIDDGIMAIDACCYYSNKLNIVKIEIKG